MKRSISILLLCAVTFGVYAQEKEQKNNSLMIFAHGGYAYSPNKNGKGLTSSSPDYAKKMSSGAGWNLQLFYRHKMFTVGMMYSGFTSKGEMEIASIDVSSQDKFINSDKILTTYIAIQLGMRIPVGNSFAICWNGGFGGMAYNNNSLVYGQPRIVKGSNLGVNLGAKAVYQFTNHFGISLEFMTISANIGKTNINYHQEDILVRYSPKIPLNQYLFSLGLTYSL